MPFSRKVYNSADLPDDMWASFRELRLGQMPNSHEQMPYDSPFFDPDFARLIGKVRGDVSITVEEDQDGLLAYWPLHIGMGGWARAIGVPFSDRNGPVVRAGETVDIAQYLHDHNISGFRTSGLVLSDRIEVNPIETVYANISDLRHDWESFAAQQTQTHKKFFKKLGRLSRKLEKEHSEIVFTFDDKCPEMFKRLITMKREQYARSKYHDVLRPSWVKQMLEQLRSGACPDLQTILSTLCIDGKLVAAELNIQSGNLLHGWLVAFDPEFGKYSPGMLLTHKIMQAMPGHGLRYYDAGTGQAHYKKYFTNTQTPIAQGPIYAQEKVINLVGILGETWSYMEDNTPYNMSKNLERVRRRTDQILGTEISTKQRVLGFSKAAFPFMSKAS
ncbi:MAG: GNAT family N-acetyltransferase [Robiginitomaculum sp.]|nr:GNAT family N-acetyltransferase [Robiginitomaculum sp.]